MVEQLGIVGAGAIACGLATTAVAQGGDVVLCARSQASASRARANIAKLCERTDGADPTRASVVTDLRELAGCSVIVEAIVEDLALKVALLGEIAGVAGEHTIVCSTTSSLSVSALATAHGLPERFVGLHVFNPVPRMQLVELAYPDEATQDTRDRARALCEALGKTPVEVPDAPGFVVNRLLFPFLFSAVELLQESGLAPEAIDTCMALGAGHPMGPLALLDYVGLDVALAIGEAIDADIPARMRALVAEGALGKKTRSGFYAYE